MKLRTYEERALAGLRRRLQKPGAKVLAVAPTGAGKTVIAAALIRYMAGKRVLWLAHRGELLEQARAQLIAAGIPASEVGILSGSYTDNEAARVLVAGIGMFRSRGVFYRDLVVIDEAHHATTASYRNVIAALPKARLLGLTATPGRLDGTPLGDVFDELYCMAEAEELIADGYLARSKVYGIPIEKARALVKGLPSSGGDWSAQAIERAMSKGRLSADIVAEWERLADGVPTIAFATTVKHGMQLRKRFRAAGVTCEMVDWSISVAERELVLGRLASGVTKVVVNVQVFAEGLDCPEVKCILLARPTKSLTLYRQMCGRGARPTAKRYLVLDQVGNAYRHGMPERVVDWSLDGDPPASGEQPLKRCVNPECGILMPANLMVCPECGTKQPEAEEVVAERKAELERVRERQADRERREQVIRKIAQRNAWPVAKLQKALQVFT